MPGFEVSEAPVGTNRRIRNRAIWAVALFAASVPPALVGIGITNATSTQVNVATPMAFGLWTVGLLFSLWAAVPTIRHWDVLPPATRWLGALPMLSNSLLLTIAVLAVSFGTR
ncbi:MAG: hypothetical protein JSR24_15140 [Proteobacteria bacterium]|nr:hypothetical protein [Pseudomonadota bacterium]